LLLKDRIGDLQRRIGLAAARSGREASAIRLVAATKMVPPTVILEAVRLGISEVGENKVQEASSKRGSLGTKTPLTHHFIGQLQTNKARRAIELFDVVQSVDRPRLAEALDRAATEARKRQRCLIEVKISDDAEKGGVPIADARDFAKSFQAYPGLRLEGLMGIAPNDATEAQTRAAFQKLARLFHDLRDCFGSVPVLSMGMSDDFEMAIEEGSTMVRIGRTIFGERVSP
jgi:hypothetical protein